MVLKWKVKSTKYDAPYILKRWEGSDSRRKIKISLIKRDDGKFAVRIGHDYGKYGHSSMNKLDGKVFAKKETAIKAIKVYMNKEAKKDF